MSFFTDANAARRARQLEWNLAELNETGRERPASDPTASKPAQNRNLGHGPEILFGRVVDCIPYVGCYKVMPERGLSVITCTYLTPGPNGIIGARAVSSIPPGAHVWFLYHRDLNYGVILGTESYFMTKGSAALSDYIYPGGRSGLHRDPAHGFPFVLNTRGIGDWSAGKPFDATMGGEWGAIVETGLRILLDSFMVQMGVSESCGFTAFLWDNLCRMSGINLQIRSNAFEHEALHDTGEHFELVSHCIYPWETLGWGRFVGSPSYQLSF